MMKILLPCANCGEGSFPEGKALCLSCENIELRKALKQWQETAVHAKRACAELQDTLRDTQAELESLRRSQSR